MLSALTSELELNQSELKKILEKVELLRGQMKNLKTVQSKVSKVLESLKNLISELPEVAIAELKKEIVSLFPSDQEPTKEPIKEVKTSTEVFKNFVTEVPKSEVNHRLEVEPIATDKLSISKIDVSGICFYLEKPNKEIEAYFAVANKNIGKEWADYLNLMGCVAEVRKSEFFDGVKWEVKATRISHKLICQVDKARPTLNSGVPGGNAEYSKKSWNGREKTKENLKESKMLPLQLNSLEESLKTTTERILIAS